MNVSNIKHIYKRMRCSVTFKYTECKVNVTRSLKWMEREISLFLCIVLHCAVYVSYFSTYHVILVCYRYTSNGVSHHWHESVAFVLFHLCRVL